MCVCVYVCVTVDGQVAPEFEVCNGLRQGCVLAPTLFNLYINLVIKLWKEKCAEFGVDVLYKCGGKLVGERTRRPCTERVMELQLAAVTTTRESMDRAASILQDLLREWGLTLSVVKTKLLVVGSEDETDLRPLKLGDDGEVECVKEFKYLGSIVEARGGVVKEVGERIAKASRAFGALRMPVFRDSNLSLTTKRMVYRAVVLGVLPQQVSQGYFGHHCTSAKDGAPQQCTNCQAVWDGGEYGRLDYSKETEVARACCADG